MTSLIVSIAVCLGCGLLGSLATASSVKTWYPTLIKPVWNPPNSVFAPVWTILYILMAVSVWLIWKKLPLESSRLPIVLFGIQLILNTAWSFIFFGLRRPDWAFIEIVVLWISIVLTLLTFWKHDWLAGALFIPYLLWVSFAVTLNAAIVALNRTL